MRRIISIILIATFSSYMMVGCSRTGTPVAPVKEAPTQNNYDAEKAQMKADSDAFMAMVDKIEPYVTTNKDHTYTVDWESFAKANPNLTASESKTMENLKAGVPIANESILTAAKSPADEEAMYGVFRWYGHVECYTGTTAYILCAYATGNLGFWSMVIPLVAPLYGWAISCIIAICAGLTAGCGGFCIVTLYMGGAYLICP